MNTEIPEVTASKSSRLAAERRQHILAVIGMIATVVGGYLLLPLSVQDQLLRLIDAIDWPLTVLILAFFFQRVLTYVFFSLDSYNFFGASGTLRPVEDVIEEQVALRLRQMKEREEKERLFAEYQEIPSEIVEYMNAQEETINELRGELAESARERYLKHLSDEEGKKD